MRAYFLAPALALGLLALLAVGVEAMTTITSPGPLTRIDLNEGPLTCEVHYGGSSGSEFYGGNACGTFLFAKAQLPVTQPTVPGVTLNLLYDSQVFGSYVPAGPSGLAPYVQLSETGPTGSGTATDPFCVTTVAEATRTLLAVAIPPAAGVANPRSVDLEITQLDCYITGDEFYTTTMTIRNRGTYPVGGILWRAGDCYLGGSDSGYGYIDPDRPGAIACAQDPTVATGRVIEWIPRSPGSSFMQAGYYEVWSQIPARTSFSNTCECLTLQDNGAGLSWGYTLEPGASVTRKHETLFSPDGLDPPPPPLPPLEVELSGPYVTTPGVPVVLDVDIDGGVGPFTCSLSAAGASATSPACSPSLSYTTGGTYTAQITVTDSIGGVAIDTAIVYVVHADAGGPYETDQGVAVPLAPAWVGTMPVGISCHWSSDDSSVTFSPNPDICLPEAHPEVGPAAPILTVTVTYDGVHHSDSAEMTVHELESSPGGGGTGGGGSGGSGGGAGGSGSGGSGSGGSTAPPGTTGSGGSGSGTDAGVAGEDSDGDGTPDGEDACPADDRTTTQDQDGDGVGDACDDDDDDDGRTDGVDRCNAKDTGDDTDRDGVDDACDPDDDADGIPDGTRMAPQDNCRVTPNDAQADLDTDGQGDACDADTDGDGVADLLDSDPRDGSRWDEAGAFATTAPSTGGSREASQASVTPEPAGPPAWLPYALVGAVVVAAVVSLVLIAVRRR